ncbi:MAG: hypothetical protein AMXMBFR13_25350 [Phycisphaerae bacterium]
MESLKVGLIGLGRGGLLLADALLASSWCELFAVASHQPHRLEKFSAAHPDIATFDDYRSLIVKNPLDALFVAVPAYLRPSYLALAAERRLPVWMLAPAARRLDEAVAWMAMFEPQNVPLVVSRSWHIEPALQAETVDLESAGRVFLARGHVMSCIGEELDWRGDAQKAGGGVLLDRGYPLIDLLVQMMGLPATAYAAAAGVSLPGGRLPYDTDDTAAVIFQYTTGAIAQISACWTAGPEESVLELYGTTGSLRVDDRQVALRDRTQGQVIHTQERAPNPLLPQVEDFLSGVRTSPRRLRGTLRQHLPTLAAIQAAYLSSRTRQPEQPGGLLDLHQIPTR